MPAIDDEIISMMEAVLNLKVTELTKWEVEFIMQMENKLANGQKIPFSSLVNLEKIYKSRSLECQK